MMQSMEEIYRTHSQTVYRYLFSLTHDAEASQELTQETFYQAVRSINRYDGTCKISTWLCAIAKNVLSTYSRKCPRTDILDNIEAIAKSAEAEMLSKTGHMEVIRHLHMLDGEMREVMYLRLLGDLSFREIGDILSKTENWARVTYYRGKEKIKKEMEMYG